MKLEVTSRHDHSCLLGHKASNQTKNKFAGGLIQEKNLTVVFYRTCLKQGAIKGFNFPSVRPSVRPSTVHVKVLYSGAVRAWSMKPCIVITLDTLFKQAPWPGALDLYFTLDCLYQYFVSSRKIYVESRNNFHFSAAEVVVRMKPCIVIVLDTLLKQAHWHCALDIHFKLHWLFKNLCQV